MFTARDVRLLKLDVWNTAVETAAKECEKLAGKIETGKATMRMQHHQGAAIGAFMCADRIRALAVSRSSTRRDK